MRLPETDATGWVRRNSTQKLLGVLNPQAGQTRCVGGCVRDSLLGIATRDTEVDMATRLRPDEVMARLAAVDIKVIPTGLAHGTLSAVMREAGTPFTFEITTLREDVATDGRHAKIAFSHDWSTDAARRDLTINALYGDGDGALYDPTGQGLSDIKTRTVRFIGAPAARIGEDYLRILRFFRFHFMLTPHAPMVAEARAACQQAAVHLAGLSGERKQAELMKILALPAADKAFFAMQGAGLLAVLFDGMNLNLARLGAMVPRENDAVLRLLALLREARDVDQLVGSLKLSNKLAKRLKTGLAPSPYLQAGADDEALYFDGPQRAGDQAQLAISAGLTDPAEMVFWQEILRAAQTYEKPVFPLTGDMMSQAGLLAGPAMGAMARALELWWVKAHFPPLEALLVELARRSRRLKS